MQRTALGVAIALLLLNTGAIGWLVASHRSQGGGVSATLTDTQLAQMEKLFRIMTDFHNELGTVTGQAAYADDKEKTWGKGILQGESLAYALSRLDYEAARRSRDVRDLQALVTGALYQRGYGVSSWATVDAPPFQRYVANTGMVSYANVSKLESLQEQFKVLAQSLIEDIK